jgi:hypothetical protein
MSAAVVVTVVNTLVSAGGTAVAAHALTAVFAATTSATIRVVKEAVTDDR